MMRCTRPAMALAKVKGMFLDLERAGRSIRRIS